MLQGSQHRLCEGVWIRPTGPVHAVQSLYAYLMCLCITCALCLCVTFLMENMDNLQCLHALTEYFHFHFCLSVCVCVLVKGLSHSLYVAFSITRIHE